MNTPEAKAETLEKIQRVEALVTGGMSVRKATKKEHLAQGTWYRYRDQVKANGGAGGAPSSAPMLTGHSRERLDKFLDKALAIAAEHHPEKILEHAERILTGGAGSGK